MHSSRHCARHILRAFTTAAFALTVAACSDPTIAVTEATAPPTHRQPAEDDPRIGEGLPAEARLAGTEHNRLTMLMLRQARGRTQRALAMQSPCETVVAGLTAESGRTAARIGIPDRAELLSTVLRAYMSTHPECRTRIARPSMASLIGDAGVTASLNGDSVITDASLQIIDQMLDRISVAQSIADITAALDAAAASATTLGAIDALAVQVAVAQSQGSLILWSEGGAGWTELEAPVAAQSLFRVSESKAGFIAGLVGALGADGTGCRGALSFMRALPIVQDPRLLAGVCGIVAAGGTVYFGYTLYHH